MKALFMIAALLGVLQCDAKGTGYRGHKGGYYSRSRVYGYGGIYLYAGGFRGSRSTSQSVVSTESLGISETDVFCKRDVRLDEPSYTSINEVTLNSTRQCFQQVTPTHGSPNNKLITSTWMDVYQWKLSTGNTQPTITMQQFNDKDDSVPHANSLLKVVITSIKEKNTANEVDLSSLTWTATRVAPVDKPVWGYPSLYFKDEATLTTFSINGVRAAGDVDVVLTFSVASDFAEDAYDDHTFVRPSGLRVDMTVSKWPFSTLVTEPLGVEFIVVSAKNTHSIGTPVASKFGTEYDPRAMNRLEVGMPNDAEARGRHFFSWKATTNNRALCMTKGDAYCADVDTSASCPVPITNAGICPVCSGQTSAFCQSLGIPAGGTASRLMIWALKSDKDLYNNNVTSAVNAKTDYLSWAFTVGTWDYAEQVASSDSCVAVPSLLLVIVGILFTL